MRDSREVMETNLFICDEVFEASSFEIDCELLGYADACLFLPSISHEVFEARSAIKG